MECLLLCSASERDNCGAATLERRRIGKDLKLKLYYAPGACSLAPHIVAQELNIKLRLVKVDLATKRTEQGDDFRAVNPLGSVPALAFDDGEVLTETAVILAYLADLGSTASSRQSCPGGYRLQEMLNFIATELHKTLGALFNPQLPEGSRELSAAMLAKRLDYLSSRLERSEFLAGAFSIADAYAFTVLSWTRLLEIDLAPWPLVQAYLGRIAGRPAVHAALVAEGLIDGSSKGDAEA